MKSMISPNQRQDFSDIQRGFAWLQKAREQFRREVFRFADQVYARFLNACDDCVWMREDHASAYLADGHAGRHSRQELSQPVSNGIYLMIGRTPALVLDVLLAHQTVARLSFRAPIIANAGNLPAVVLDLDRHQAVRADDEEIGFTGGVPVTGNQ
jgi:hypothetical protein